MPEQNWPEPGVAEFSEQAVLPQKQTQAITVPASPPAAGVAMRRRNPVAIWLGLPLITFGIYHYVWWYKVNAEMANFDRRNPVNPGATLCAFLFGWIILIPPYLAIYGTGQRIADRQRAAGLVPTCSAALGIVLTFFFGLSTLYYQSELNKIVDRYGNVPAGSPVPLAA